jgi:hypothetical protein
VLLLVVALFLRATGDSQLMSNLTEQNWRDLYRDALLESDPVKARPRVDKAYQAIEHRLKELENSRETLEIRELNAALYFLRLLRLAAPRRAEDLDA